MGLGFRACIAQHASHLNFLTKSALSLELSGNIAPVTGSKSKLPGYTSPAHGHSCVISLIILRTLTPTNCSTMTADEGMKEVEGMEAHRTRTICPATEKGQVCKTFRDGQRTTVVGAEAWGDRPTTSAWLGSLTRTNIGQNRSPGLGQQSQAK